MNLDEYFHRIGYQGPRAPTLETLAGIHFRHALSIPFENLSPLLRRPVLLDEESLQQKLVRDGRGGYCFEQNTLLRLALTQLGFQVTGLAARVVWNAPPDAVTMRGHMLLLIDLGSGRYIADVGFGGMTLTGPILLQADEEQLTPHEPFRLTEAAGDSWMLQVKIKDEWKALYRFDLQEQSPVDYEVMSWYMSNHPASHFVTGLSVARPETDRRYALRNNQLSTYLLNGETERRTLTSAAELRATLEDVFGLTLPVDPELGAVLQRLAVSGEASSSASLS